MIGRGYWYKGVNIKHTVFMSTSMRIRLEFENCEEALSQSDMSSALLNSAPSGSTVTFECVAFGIPDPTVRWTNGSSDMASSFFSNKYTERGVESKLVISNVKSHFRGKLIVSNFKFRLLCTSRIDTLNNQSSIC